MRAVGPDAPTLCGDWTTRDLAAHLVVRERRLDATPGIAIPFLAGYTAKVQHEVAQSSDWDDLLGKIASGPPLLSPFKLIDSVANMGECSFTTRTFAAPNLPGNQELSMTRRCGP